MSYDKPDKPMLGSLKPKGTEAGPAMRKSVPTRMNRCPAPISSVNRLIGNNFLVESFGLINQVTYECCCLQHEHQGTESLHHGAMKIINTTGK